MMLYNLGSLKTASQRDVSVMACDIVRMFVLPDRDKHDTIDLCHGINFLLSRKGTEDGAILATGFAHVAKCGIWREDIGATDAHSSEQRVSMLFAKRIAELLV
jgi:hypothetical protein